MKQKHSLVEDIKKIISNSNTETMLDKGNLKIKKTRGYQGYSIDTPIPRIYKQYKPTKKQAAYYR